MKRALKVTLLAITAFVTIISLSRCKVDEGGIYGAFPYMNVPLTDTLISKVEQTISIPIETNRTISARVTDALWLNAETEGSNLILTISQNELEVDRSATVEIMTVNSTIKTKITIIQSASGELTIIGDLILKSVSEIEANTYTKSTQSIIIGNVISNVAASNAATITASLAAKTSSAAANSDITVKFDNKLLTISPTDISDREMDILSEKIHMVGNRSAAVLNTKITSIPYKLVFDNNIDKAYFVACDIKNIPSKDSLKALNLKEFNISKNKLSDISSINGLDSLQYLNVSDNQISDISTIGSNTNLRELILDGNKITNIESIATLQKLEKLSIKGLPILPTQYEILSESLPEGCVTDTAGIKSEDSPLVKLGTPEETDHTDKSLTISVKVLDNGESNPTKYGYYWGKSKKLSQMQPIDGVYNEEEHTITTTVTDIDTQNQVYFFRAFAENGAGKSYSAINKFGDIIQKGNYIIRNKEELEDFYNDVITQIHGSLFVGNVVDKPNDNTITVSCDTTLYFDHSDISSLEHLSNISYIEGGLYIVNTDIQSANGITRLEHLTTLSLAGNKLTAIPNISNILGLKSINLSRNQISDLTPILNAHDVDSLRLGDNRYPYKETNNIGVLTGLETLTGLKYLDLSGLPLHTWQVEDLKTSMPGCHIEFIPGNRKPFLPSVQNDAASISGSQVTIKGTLTNKGEGQIIDYGFYWGKDINNLTKISVGTNDINNGTVFERTININDEDIYYYQPYATNIYGEVTSRDYREFTLSFTNLSERGTSNCYIVSNAGRYTFNPHIIGNGTAGIIDTANFHTTSEVINPATIELIWETTAGMVTDLSYRTETKDVVFTSDGNEGSALIGAKDSNGKIIWSWHIWITDRPVEHTYINKQGRAFRVLDRNLGATRADRGTGEQWKESTGHSYQWGRKDPFAIEHCEYASGTYTIEQSISLPTYYFSETWMTELNKNLWHPSIKTIYDPCPVGYKAPVSDIWTNFVKEDKQFASSTTELNIRGEWDYGFNFIYDGLNSAWYPPIADFNYKTTNWARYLQSNGHTINWENNIAHCYFYYNSNMDMHWSIDSWYRYGIGGAVRCMLDDGYVDITLPTITLDNIDDIGHDSAKATGTLHNNGSSDVTAIGFVIDTRHTPTIATGTKLEVSPTTGQFTGNFTGLRGFTTYYIRAYATNANGTAYSNELTFTTQYNGTIINLSDSGTANCYIVPPTTDHYSFDVSVIGNGTSGIIDSAKFHTSDPSISPESIEVLWARKYNEYHESTSKVSDLLSFIEFNKSTQSVHIVPTGIEGNVLIAAKDSDQKIIWSWHLWITDKPAEHAYINYEGKIYTVMDRNIGATRADRGTGEEWRQSSGFAYQWGRKDPLHRNTQSASFAFSIEQSIQYPQYSSSNWNWISDSEKVDKYSLWTYNTKTIYDPCPVGYKVIAGDAWTGFTKNGQNAVILEYVNMSGSWSNGFWFIYDGTNSAWFPSTIYGNSPWWRDEYGAIWGVTPNQESTSWSYNAPYLEYYYNGSMDASVNVINGNGGLGESRAVRCMVDQDHHDNAYPYVLTGDVADVTSSSITIYGNVTSEGLDSVTERGFVWNTSDSPTIKNNHISVHTESSFLGEYNGTIKNLKSGTTYYVRAYATSSRGTSYGKEVKVRTKDGGSSEDVGRDDDFEW